MKTKTPPILPSFLALIAIALTPSQFVGAAPATARLIVPGHSIGQLHVGSDGNAQLRKMPNAQDSDAGMSQNRLVWVSGKSRNTLFVHTVSNGALDVKPLSGVTITEINATSPYFRTASGISTGATFSQVKRAFPHVRRSTAISTGRSVIYDDARQGIAFEFARASNSARCVAITVYRPGKSPSAGSPVSLASVKNLL